MRQTCGFAAVPAATAGPRGELPISEIDCETKRKVKKEVKGGARDWIGFRSPEQDV